MVGDEPETDLVGSRTGATLRRLSLVVRENQIARRMLTFQQPRGNCCTIQMLVGWRVTLKCRMRRRSWPMMKKQYRTPKVRVGTVKKSMAAIASCPASTILSPQRLLEFPTDITN